MSGAPQAPRSDVHGGPQLALAAAAPAGVAEAIERYEAAMRRYAAAAAAYTVPVRKTTSTSAARAVRLARPKA